MTQSKDMKMDGWQCNWWWGLVIQDDTHVQLSKNSSTVRRVLIQSKGNTRTQWQPMRKFAKAEGITSGQ